MKVAFESPIKTGQSLPITCSWILIELQNTILYTVTLYVRNPKEEKQAMSTFVIDSLAVDTLPEKGYESRFQVLLQEDYSRNVTIALTYVTEEDVGVYSCDLRVADITYSSQPEMLDVLSKNKL